MAFNIKQNDTSPSLQATLKDASGTAIALGGASCSSRISGSRCWSVGSTSTPEPGLVPLSGSDNPTGLLGDKPTSWSTEESFPACGS